MFALSKSEDYTPDKYKEFMKLYPDSTASRDKFHEVSAFILLLLQGHPKSVADEDVDDTIIVYFKFKAYHLGKESSAWADGHSQKLANSQV
jgi:hypothetical protein